MEQRYERNFPAITPEEFLRLRRKRVAVIGCGGLGGHIIELLSRMGIGAIRVVDGDVFEASNLNRQLLSDTETMGRSKAQVAADRVRRVNPQVEVDAVWTYLNESNALHLLEGCDVAIDALDNIASRKLLEEACRRAGIPYVYGAIQGWVAQAAVSMPGEGLVEKLFPPHVQIRDKSVLSFTPALCAAMQVALCAKLLVGRPVQTGTVFYYDLLNQEAETIPFL